MGSGVTAPPVIKLLELKALLLFTGGLLDAGAPPRMVVGPTGVRVVEGRGGGVTRIASSPYTSWATTS